MKKASSKVFAENKEKAARKYDLPVVLASTSSLYSRCPPPHSESQEVVPGSFYEMPMLTREGIARLYTDLYGMSLVGLRYFSVYGPPRAAQGEVCQQYQPVPLESCKRGAAGDIRRREPDEGFHIHRRCRGGEHTRHALEAEWEIINVGTGTFHSFNSVIEKLNAAMVTNIVPKYVKNPLKNYVAHTLAETSKAEKLLGFRAKVTLAEGIDRIVKYYASLKK